jgi:hypothetical protein
MVYKPERNSFWTCHSCGWKHEAVCGSDVLLPKPEKCKKCGGTEFEIRLSEVRFLINKYILNTLF